jgi:RNA polymerase sigma-70 factor (ECF subfamily)
MAAMNSETAGIVEALLDRARHGDNEARDELFARCRSFVGIVARAEVESWMQAKVDASDLVQQTLLDAHRGWDGFRGTTEGEWLAWLRRILSNNTADYVRRYHGTAKRRARREVPLDRRLPGQSSVLVGDPSDPGDSPSQALMRLERQLEVAEALAKLPDDYQEVIMLRNLQRLPFSEVAARMGRSRPAVQMLWMRALEKLQETLKSSHSIDGSSTDS